MKLRLRLLLAWTLLFMACPSCLVASLPNPTDSAPPASSYEFRLIVLDEQTDPSLYPPPRSRKLSALVAHHRTVVEALQRTAETTQQPILKRLDSLREQGEIRSYRSFWVANVIAVEGTEAAFAALESIPHVAAVERDLHIIPIEIRTIEDRNTLDAIAPIGLRQIRAPQVWEMGITGAGVLIGNFDSGVNGTHPSLTGRWRGSCGYPASQCWLDLAGTATAPTDANGHGTQTMSIQCGMVTGDTVGVAWGARYLAARLNMNNGASMVSTALQAFQWAIDPDGNPATFDDVPRVLSCSWGLETGVYQPCYNVLNTAIDNCEAAGTAVFWAAGNEGANGAQTIRIPADRAVTEVNTFAVGAYDYLYDLVWSQSSRGPTLCGATPSLQFKPEVVAPGRYVRIATLGTAYASGTGTSYAAPHVAGVAALMLETNPALTPDSLKKMLLLTAVDMGPAGNDNSYGYGLVDAYGAVMAAAGGVGWISGHVMDVYDWDVPATVSITDHPQWTSCDEAGHFLLPMPAQMPFELRVSAPTFDTTRQTVILEAGETLDLEILLNLSQNCGLLTGTVVNCSNNPAANARISFTDTALSAVLTDDEGHFRKSLLAGVYDVHAADGYCAAGVTPAVGVAGRGITDIEVVLPPNPAYQCSAPDAFGYQACDDKDPGGPISKWTAIDPTLGGSGIIYNLSEDGSLLLVAPFPISYYGMTRERFYLNANGNITFLRIFFEYVNTALPRGVTPAIYPYWTDLSDYNGGNICGLYEPSLGTYTLEWSNVPRYWGDGNETFQAIFFDPAVYPTTSGNAIVEFHYRDLSVINESTVGIEGPSGSGYLQYLFNGAYASHACSLSSGRAIRFVAGQRLSVSPQLTVMNPAITLFTSPGQRVDTALLIANTGTGPAAFTVSSALPPFGNYSWTSSRLTGGPPFEFTTIASVGQNLGIARDDTTTDPIRLPWFFPLYDRHFDRVAVCSNGYISFNSGSYDRSWSNSQLSDQHDPYYALAPYWVDLDASVGGSILKYFDEVRDRFIIQWNQVPRYNETSPNTFQVILYPDGIVEFVYDGLSAPLSNGTVGIKGRNASQYLQLAYRQTFLQANTLVRISRPDTSAASCVVREFPQGVIPAGTTVRVPVRLTNNLLSFGEKTFPMTVRSSDSLNPALTAQIVLNSVPSPDGLHLVIVSYEQGVRLSWNRVPAPRYCVYSGASLSDPLNYFETSITDTFVVLPYSAEELRFFEVRLCDTTP